MKTKRFVSISLALCLVLILGQNVAFAFDSDAAAQRYVRMQRENLQCSKFSLRILIGLRCESGTRRT